MAGCEDLLVQKLDRVLARMKAQRLPMMVTDGFRSVAQQQAIWWFDRLPQPGGLWIPKPGITKHRTECDGILKLSNHQADKNCQGRAADCTFIINGQPSWHDNLPYHLYAEAQKAEGLVAGFYWPKPDKPHAELPKETSNA